MAKPILNKIQSYDASNDYTVGFSYNGSQTYKNELIITDAKTGDTVYDAAMISFQLYHTIPKDTLTNGRQYIAQIRCFDKDDNASSLSDGMYFYCIKTPEFYFRGLTEGQTIASSSLPLQLYYDQEDEEQLKDYQYFLYDAGRINILTSDIFYSGDLSYRFIGLEDGKQYYIRAKGNTVHGLEIDTGYIKIVISYTEPPVTNQLITACDRCAGSISWSTNIIVINCSNSTDYSFDGDFIDLLDKTLRYNTGFLLNGDFTLQLKGKNLNRDGRIFSLSNGTDHIMLSSSVYNEKGDQRFHLSISNGLSHYNKFSEKINLSSEDTVEFLIRKIDNLFKLAVFRIIGEKTNDGRDTAYYYGYRMPYFPIDKAIWIDEEQNNDDTDTENVQIDVSTRTIYIAKDEPANPKDRDIWIESAD